MTDTTDTEDVIYSLRAYATREWGIESRVPYLMNEAADALERLAAENAELRKEIDRLTKCLKGANAQAEHFEREMYLRELKIDTLEEMIKELEMNLDAWEQTQ